MATYNRIEDLLEELIRCFETRSMFQTLEERDIVSILPIQEEEAALKFLQSTNDALANYFDIHDELCYSDDSMTNQEENPIFFWKDYLNCFFDFELIDDDHLHDKYLGTGFGIYQITRIVFVDDVNKRFRKRKLNGLSLGYKVKPSPMDRHHHWNRTYDKDF